MVNFIENTGDLALTKFCFLLVDFFAYCQYQEGTETEICRAPIVGKKCPFTPIESGLGWPSCESEVCYGQLII